MHYKKMKTKYNNFDTSLRRLLWSDNQNQTKVQTMISATIIEWYEAKHRRTSIEELELINSIVPTRCHQCSSKTFTKYEFRNGLKIYKCKECGRKFTNLTNTIFDSKKVPITEWIELLHLFEFHSVKLQN